MKNELLSAQREGRSFLQLACTRYSKLPRIAGELGEKIVKYSSSLAPTPPLAQVAPGVKQIARSSPEELSLTWEKLDLKDGNPPQRK